MILQKTMIKKIEQLENPKGFLLNLDEKQYNHLKYLSIKNNTSITSILKKMIDELIKTTA